MKLLLTILLFGFVLIPFNDPFLAYSQENTSEPKTFLWKETDGTYRTFDDFTLKASSEATWIISDEELFKNRLGDKNWADGRLSEIIPPAIRTHIASNRVNELYEDSEGQKYIAKHHTDEIIKLFDKLTQKFGIKVTDLKISVNGV